MAKRKASRAAQAAPDTANRTRTMTHEEWLEEGKRRFGPDYADWAFKCPACGRVSTTQDHFDAGGDPDHAMQNCIGRVNGKGADGRKGKDEGHGCNWAAYGLFGTLGRGIVVIMPDGSRVNAFDFAPAAGKEAESI